MRWLATLAGHPRHAVLFAATAGLLVGPLSRPAAVAIAAAITLTAGLTPLARGVLVAAAAALLAGALVADLRLSSLESGRLPVPPQARRARAARQRAPSPRRRRRPRRPAGGVGSRA